MVCTTSTCSKERYPKPDLETMPELRGPRPGPPPSPGTQSRKAIRPNPALPAAGLKWAPDLAPATLAAHRPRTPRPGHVAQRIDHAGKAPGKPLRPSPFAFTKQGSSTQQWPVPPWESWPALPDQLSRPAELRTTKRSAQLTRGRPAQRSRSSR